MYSEVLPISTTIQKKRIENNKNKKHHILQSVEYNILARNAFKPWFAPNVALGWQELFTTPEFNRE